MTRTEMPVSRTSLHWRAEALDHAIETGAEQLPPELVTRARTSIAQVMQRTSIAGSHTVAALAGATGSGKSSLFNALVGERVAVAGPLRPTTSKPTAAAFGDEPAGELLNWLEVDRRHQAHDPQFDGLVLLDLPDVDSREVAHRTEADRVLALVDVFVWVTDPQKYADARLHEDYLRTLREHGATTVVVLNHADRLSDNALEACVADLARLLELDGIGDARLLTTSAVTGDGIPELRAILADAVESRVAAETRLTADLRSAAAALRDHVADSEPKVGDQQATQDLVQALGRAAGVPAVLDAVERDYVRQAGATAGWPFARWTRIFRPDPMRRLRLDTAGGSPVSMDDLRVVLGRSSLPPATPAARANVQLASRQLAEKAGRDLPAPWGMAIDTAADPRESDLTDALDQAVMGTSLRERVPLWWRITGAFQWLFAAALAVGAVWLIVLAVLDWLRVPTMDTPMLTDRLPWPTALLIIGLAGGLILSMVVRFAARVGAKRRRVRVGKRLENSIREVAVRYVVEPIKAVLERHRTTRDQLDAVLKPVSRQG